MKRVQQGFTLIELMIVVAIIGILAAIALPAYQDYLVRSKITEGLARASEAKVSIAEFVSSNQRWPTTVSAGFNSAAAGKVTSVKCGTTCNTLDITMNTTAIPALTATTNVVQLSARSSVNGLIVWKCKGGTNAIPVRFLPSECR